MSRGYAEGPALEERLAALESRESDPEVPVRQAVYGSTEDDPVRHFIGWLGDVDPNELFESGRAWGLSVVRKHA